MSIHTVPLHPEVASITFTDLLQEFARQVSNVADQQFANQISWDDATAQIEFLIQDFRLTAQQLGFLQADDSEFDPDLAEDLGTQLGQLLNQSFT